MYSLIGSDNRKVDNVIQDLSDYVSQVISKISGNNNIDIKIKLSTDSKFGDYQFRLHPTYAEHSKQIISELSASKNFEKVTYIKKYVNIIVNPEYLSKFLNYELYDKTKYAGLKVLVDFSSPNIAKEMHVGHLRSTIIGDTICRLYEKYGATVVRMNHIGDWGTQFGMLINYLKINDIINLDIKTLQLCYQKSKILFDSDEKFKINSLTEVVKLQNNDKENTQIWNNICHISNKEYRQIYNMLNIDIEDRGESFYQPFMKTMIKELEKSGHLEIDKEGRKVLHVKGFKIPLILVKSDGGYTYDTSDLAAVKYRTQIDKADKIIYVVDSGQSLHLETVFAASKMLGYADKQELVHVKFGLVLNEQGKRIKTREGKSVKLKELLNESLETTKEIFKKHLQEQKTLNDREDNILIELNKQNELSDDVNKLIQILAYGSIKYADLRNNRIKNYKFSFDRMLQFEGDTAIYTIYTYVRLCGILRKIGDIYDKDKVDYCLINKKEIDLCKHILQFSQILDIYESTLCPSKLTSYLYDLANITNKFYTVCPVLDKGKVNCARLKFIKKVMTIFELCFNILGLEYCDIL